MVYTKWNVNESTKLCAKMQAKVTGKVQVKLVKNTLD